MDTLTGALIGAGFFAQFHADGWNRIEGVKIAAVVDPDQARARSFAERWSIPTVYADVDQLLKNEKPDFVDIATRPDTHAALVEKAAARGIHVLCQKPMAPTWEACVRMVQAAESAKVRLLIHENWRWQPWFREMKRLLDSERLGKAYHVDFTMRTGDGRGKEPYGQQPYFRDMDRLLVYETAVHFLDTFRFLLGEIRQVDCRTQRINPVIRGEDCAIIRVEFVSGSQGLIDANRIAGPLPVPVTLGTCRLEGDRGLVRLDPEGKLFLTEYGEAERAHVFASTDQGYKGDSVRATNAHLADCLRTGAPCESEGREYLKTVALVEACYESARTQHPVEPRRP